MSLLNEHRRRHGMREGVGAEKSTVGELASEARKQLLGGKKDEKEGRVRAEGQRSEEEERLQVLKSRVGERRRE